MCVCVCAQPACPFGFVFCLMGIEFDRALCLLDGRAQWPVFFLVSAHNRQDPIKSFGAIKANKEESRAGSERSPASAFYLFIFVCVSC